MIETKIKNTSKYSGGVRVKGYNNGSLYLNREIHNSGTVNLCAYICDCLRGMNAISARPAYLIPCTWNSSTNELVEMFNYGILYTGLTTTSTDDTGAYYTLKFLIPASVLLGQTKIDGFKLFSADSTRKLYATVDTHLNPIALVSNSNLSIEWDLKISY